LDRFLALDPAYVYLTHYGRVGNVQQLAHRLRRGLVAYQQIAHRHAGATDRHAAIKEALMAHALQELQAMNAPLSEQQARDLLAFDMELNTQGLEVWLDKKKAA
jgi:hypothetical protein